MATPGIVQLKFNLKVAPAGEALADVSSSVSLYKLVTSRESVTIPPNGATARRSSAAGTEATDLQITFRSNMTAAGLWAVLFEVIKTDDAEIDFEGTQDAGVVSADNPLFSGTAVLLQLDTGADVGSLRGQTITLPVTDAGITVATAP